MIQHMAAILEAPADPLSRHPLRVCGHEWDLADSPLESPRSFLHIHPFIPWFGVAIALENVLIHRYRGDMESLWVSTLQQLAVLSPNQKGRHEVLLFPAFYSISSPMWLSVLISQEKGYSQLKATAF